MIGDFNGLYHPDCYLSDTFKDLQYKRLKKDACSNLNRRFSIQTTGLKKHLINQT